MLRRKNRRRLTHLVLTGLVLRLVLSVLHLPILMTGAANADLTSVAGGQQVVICTAAGPRVVTLDADGNPVDDTGAPVQVADCALCSVANSTPPILKSAELSVSVQRTLLAIDHIVAKTLTVRPPPLRLTRGQDPPHQTV